MSEVYLLAVVDLGSAVVAGRFSLAAGAGGDGVDHEGQHKAEDDGWAKTEHGGGVVYVLVSLW